MEEKDKIESYSGEFFKYIMDNMYEGIYFCDRQRKITYWNSAYSCIPMKRANPCAKPTHARLSGP